MYIVHLLIVVLLCVNFYVLCVLFCIPCLHVMLCHQYDTVLSCILHTLYDCTVVLVSLCIEPA